MVHNFTPAFRRPTVVEWDFSKEMCLSDSETGAHENAASLSLAIGLRRGSEDAWSRLVDLYAPLIRSWCLYSGVPQHRITDVLQDVFVAIYQNVEHFEPKECTSGFRGWVWMITRNKINDHFRVANKQPTALGGSSALGVFAQIAEKDLPDDPPSRPSDTASLLHRALSMVKVDFKEPTWEAFWRSCVLGQSTQMIADDLGLSAASVRQSKSRVLRRLRQQLGDME